MITWENYEEYMMMHADGELKPAEEQALMAFVAANPELEKELAAYGMTKLSPDTTVVFEDKSSLLKEHKKVIAFPRWQRYSIAAGIAAIIFISLFRQGAADNNTAVATVDNRTPQVVQPAGKSNNTVQQQAAAINDTEAKHTTTGNATATVTTINNNKQIPTAIQHTQKRPTTGVPAYKEHTAQLPVAASNKINELSPAGVKELSNQHIAAAAPAMTAIPSLPETVNEEPNTKGYSISLPIDELKRQGRENVNAVLALGADKINAIKQEISETSLTIKVERRKLILSF